MNKLRLLVLTIMLALMVAACGAPAATPVPTVAPTSPPPAATPTTAPTVAPTMAPTEAPTMAPTETPAVSLRTPQEAALAAANGQKIGGSVDFLGPWGGTEQASFEAVYAPFQEATGITVNYTGSRNLIAIVTTRVQGGNPPDMTDFANPGQLLQFAAAGNLQPLDDVLDMTTYQQQYAKTWLDLASYNSQLYGIAFKAAVKGLIWYDPKVWSADSYSIPPTWDDMITLSKNIAGTGATPWCVAVESGAASGWPGTDWLEDIVLRQSGETVYNDWWQGKQKWTSPEIKQAWQTWGEIVATSGMVYGGPSTMLSTNFGDVGNGLFTTPPNCYMVHQASFIDTYFTSNNPGVQPITDFNYFPFPPFNLSAPKATETGGDIVAMFNKTPQAEAFIRYLATPEAQAIWAARGGGYLSANKDIPLSVYPSQLARDETNLLTSAEVVVFDASDQMPAAMTNAFYTAVLDYIQKPSSLDSILANLDSVQVSAYQAPSATATPAATPTPAPSQYTVMSAANSTLGAIMVDGAGMTLYNFSIDKPNESMCTGACAQFWPPLTVTEGVSPTVSPEASGGISSTLLTTFKRADGSIQVAYDTRPLYTFVEDKAPGDANGQGLNVQGGYWYVVETDDGIGAPDFTQYGFPTVAASMVITPGQAYTIDSGAYTVDIPDGAFDMPVKFDLLTGVNKAFTPPAGETTEFAFAFRVTNAYMPTEVIGKFYKPVMLTIKSPNIVADSKYYNVDINGKFSVNPTGLVVSAGTLQHPIAGSGVGWVVTSPTTAPPPSATATPTTTYALRTPQEAALAAANGQKIGGSVDFLGPWGGGEQASFMAVIAPFEEATGIQVNYTGSRNLLAIVTTRVQGGNPPDMTDFANPGQLLQFASAGNLQPLDSVLDMTTYQQQYAKTWLDLAGYNNQLYGVAFKAAVKGLIWYNTKVWSTDNYTIPPTWDDMITLSKNIASTGATPWCVALESGAASGWPGTDWLEDIVLRQSGETVYNDWWQGKQKWTSPEIKQAWQTWGEIVATSGMVYGGPNTMLSTNFGNVGDGLFTTPPHCYMVHQASFIASFFTADVPGIQPVTNFDYFPFPPFSTSAPKATETGGDIVAMFNKTPQAEAFIRYLATPEAQAIWAARGGGYLSANKDVPQSVYPDALSRAEGNLLTSVSVVVFDASDQMPAAMTNAFYTAVLDYIQNPSSLDSILANLDSVQASAYSGQ